MFICYPPPFSRTWKICWLTHKWLSEIKFSKKILRSPDWCSTPPYCDPFCSDHLGSGKAGHPGCKHAIRNHGPFHSQITTLAIQPVLLQFLSTLWFWGFWWDSFAPYLHHPWLQIAPHHRVVHPRIRLSIRFWRHFGLSNILSKHMKPPSVPLLGGWAPTEWLLTRGYN